MSALETLLAALTRIDYENKIERVYEKYIYETSALYVHTEKDPIKTAELVEAVYLCSKQGHDKKVAADFLYG